MGPSRDKVLSDDRKFKQLLGLFKNNVFAQFFIELLDFESLCRITFIFCRPIYFAAFCAFQFNILSRAFCHKLPVFKPLDHKGSLEKNTRIIA